MMLLHLLGDYLYGLPTAFFFLLIVKRFLPVPKLWRQLVLWLAGAVMVSTTIWIADAANILGVALIMFTSVPLLCKGRPLARVSIAVLLFSAVISVSAILDSLRPPFDGYRTVFTFVIWLGIYLFVRHFIQPGTVDTIRKRLWLQYDALALLPFGITVIIVLFSQWTRTYTVADAGSDPLAIGNEGVLLLLLALAAVYAVGLLLSVALLARQEQLEQQRVLWTIRQQYYNNVEQNQQQVRRLRHDMANHLAAMAGMDDVAMRRYLAQLINTPAMAGGRRFCENETVNAVLASKWPAIEQEGIREDLRVTVPAALSLSDVDLCAIFANSLDNAMEACRQCPPDARFITLHAKTEKGIFAFRLENSMTGALKAQNGKLLTTKPDKASHGFGMAEIQDIVQQHNGVLQYEQNGEMFQMRLSIPVT